MNQNRSDLSIKLIRYQLTSCSKLKTSIDKNVKGDSLKWHDDG